MPRRSIDDAQLEERVAARLADLGLAMAEQLPALTADLFSLEEQIEELRGDQVILELLAASNASNLDNVVHLLRGHIPAEELRIPSAAEEYARRLAQRGVASNALVRAYRMGHRMVLEWGFDHLAAEEPHHDVALVAGRRLVQITFDYIEVVVEAAIVAYEGEREHWLANRTSVRLEVLDALLAATPPDLARAEAALGYRLRQHHVALLLWHTGATSTEADFRDLERLLARVARALGSSGSPLFVPRDRATGWGWVPLGRQASDIDLDVVHEVMTEAPAGVRVAVGSPGPGEAGFRTSHQEALRAQTVAMVARDRARTVTAYADPMVRAAALLAQDLPSTRDLVHRTLGPLAEDSEATARMRETLLTFLSERSSYAATATRMHLHKNTVRYRVERAIETRGKELDEDRLDLELALIACDRLGDEVLSGTPA